MSNPLVAQAQDSTKAYSGISLAESASDLKSAIESGDWASVALGSVGTALDALSMAMDPFGAALAAGVGWLIEHVGPLKEALNALAGNADEIAAQSETWKNIATELGGVGGDLASMVSADTASWTGIAADTYRLRAANTVSLLSAAQKGCEGASSGVKTAGEVVAAVRALVRDIIAELVGHMISWALQVVFTLGIGLIWVVPQVINAVAKTASKIADITKRLVKALQSLIPLLKRAGDLFADASKGLRDIKPGAVKAQGKVDSVPSGPKDPSAGPKGGGAGEKGAAKPPPDGSTTPSGSPGAPPKADPPPVSKAPDEPPKAPDEPPRSTDPSPGTGPDGRTNPSGTPKGGPATPARISESNPNPAEHTTPSPDKSKCGDPIDVATGAVLLEQTDLTLPGALPVEFGRTHLSSYQSGRFFGPTWTSTVDERIEVEPDGLYLALADGLLLRYPMPRGMEAVLPDEGPYLALRRVRHGFVVGDPQSDRMRYFAARAGQSTLPLRAVVDGAGNRIEVQYRDGVPVAIEHSGGYRVEIDSADGLITALRVPGSPVALCEYRYDAAGRLAEVIDPAGTPQRFRYDADGRIVRWEDVNGRWYSYGYDAEGRCVRAQGTDGYLDTELAYDRENLVTTVTDSLGGLTRYRLDERLRVIGRTDPLGNTTSTELDRFGRAVSSTDELGHVTRWERDAVGNVVTVVRADGSRMTTEYDARNRPVLVTGPDGAAWRYEHDERGRLVRSTDPIGAVDAYTYDEATGTMATVTDALGGVTRFEANAAGLPVTVTAPDGAVTRYTYDELGRTASVTDPLGAVSRMARNAAGELVEQVDADGAVHRFASTARGNTDERTGPRGGVSRVEYAHFDLPVVERRPDGGVLRYGYDTELRLVTVTNEQGGVWRFDYDPAGRLVRETDYNGRVLDYAYDPAGRLVLRSNGAGQTIVLERDALGRLIRRRSADEVAEFAYDGADRMVLARNAHSEVRFSHDALGRVVAESVNGRVVSSGYDPLGRRTHRHTPSGAESVFGYDPRGRATSMVSAGRTLRFEYDLAGRETVRRLLTGAGIAAELRQDWTPSGQLATQTVRRGGATVQRREYGYLPDGYLSAVNDLISGPRDLDVTPGGQVLAVRGARWQERYTYDLAGAITAADWPGAPGAGGPRAYQGTLLTSAGATRYGHDTDGRVAFRERGAQRWEYRWSAENRLIGVRTPQGANWRYRYDALGRRIAKQHLDEAGAVVEQTEFAWDGTLLAEEVRGVPGRPLTATVWEWAPGAERPLTQTERVLGGPEVNDRFHAIVTDLVGSPAELLDDSGALAGHQHTALWGPMVSTGGQAGTPLRFPGQYHDPETGLHYNLHRYYDPETGRYLSHDPLGLTPDPDSLAYVGNPTALIDPLGLAKVAPCADAAGGGGGGGKKPDRFHPYSRPNEAPPVKRRKHKYPEGTYGDKDFERKRLEKEFGSKIDGNSTHQSEHTAGFDVLNDNGGPSKVARKDDPNLENNAWAYYEEHGAHRGHPGTGTGSAVHESGFNSTSYRESQRNALEANDPNTAIQLNQLGYAHQPGFQGTHADPEMQIRRDMADDSYHRMVDDVHRGGEGLRYNPAPGADVPTGGATVPGTGAAGNPHVTTRPLDDADAFELHEARNAARTGDWPGDEAWQRYYPDPTPQDWARLERGDFDPPQLPGGGDPMDLG
ncbi:RHS repeat-associated core domain-containing protein [Amycolatopsis sp. H20-H5]|uniref:RHS repeat-associated core domain-containing protein n=1 Tax=Amycolatopsis sp. H20-H5 TaxID=3046309 RepID=UPI002DB59C02|nr:RHS repeat-associated core domain-containing protein [Amycolatopsis sp. H20-H5]MEC3977539.1 RHS repeat-associated core domain-containing protein [Amycolatopsis sp. H20-H5]